MPSVQDAINADRSKLTPIEPKPEAPKPPARDQRVDSLLKSPYARCPLPPSNNSADSLRQWGQGSDVPKFRTQTPPSNIGGSGGTSSSTASSVVVSSSSSSTSTLPAAQNVGITTSPLAPNQTWIGSVQMAKGFIVLRATGNTTCRIELYGTKTAQSLDLSRDINTDPTNTTQGLILDVVLLTALSWQVLDCVGANGDSPQSATIYITITNLSVSVQSVTASLQFVPEQS